MISKAKNIIKLIKNLVLVLGIISIIVALIVWYRRSKKSKGLSVSDFFFKLTDEEFTILNDEKEMMI